MEEMLATVPEGVAGHFRIFDPGVGSPNLIQRVRLVGFHEEHHFRIIRRLLNARKNVIRQAARGLKSAPAS